MKEKTTLYYISEIGSHFIFEVHAGEGDNEQLIGFAKLERMPIIDVAKLLPDQYTYAPAVRKETWWMSCKESRGHDHVHITYKEIEVFKNNSSNQKKIDEVKE